MLSFHRKSLYTVITIIGLGYFVAYATIQFVADWLGGTIPFFDYYHVPFIVLFLLSIFLVWTRPRIGYLLSIIIGLVGVAIFTPFTFVKGLSSPRGHWTLRLRDDHLPIDTCRSIIFSDGSPRNAETSTSQLPNVLNTLPRNRCSSPRIHSRRIHRGRFGSWNRKPASLVRWNLRRHHHSSRRWNAR